MNDAAVPTHMLLRRSVRRFEPAPVTDRPILITTVRKAMTHAIRSVFAHFLGMDRLHPHFVGDKLSQSEFSDLRDGGAQIFVGHVRRSLPIENIFNEAPIVLAIRDPVTCVHSRASRLLNERKNSFGKSVQRLDSIEAAYHYAIFGGKVQRGGFPSLRQEYERIALAWLHRADLVLRYEDLRSPEAETIVLDGLRKLFTDKLPDDAAARVKAGLDPKVSASYSPNRVTPPDLPLQDIIEALMPGIRKALGYDQERKLCL